MSSLSQRLGLLGPWQAFFKDLSTDGRMKSSCMSSCLVSQPGIAMSRWVHCPGKSDNLLVESCVWHFQHCVHHEWCQLSAVLPGKPTLVVEHQHMLGFMSGAQGVSNPGLC